MYIGEPPCTITTFSDDRVSGSRGKGTENASFESVRGLGRTITGSRFGRDNRVVFSSGGLVGRIPEFSAAVVAPGTYFVFWTGVCEPVLWIDRSNTGVVREGHYVGCLVPYSGSHLHAGVLFPHSMAKAISSSFSASGGKCTRWAGFAIDVVALSVEVTG